MYGGIRYAHLAGKYGYYMLFGMICIVYEV